MSFAKTHLKTARECLSKKDYTNAKKYAVQVLEFDPDNYNAHVFLGLALLELGEYDESEQVYQKAIELNPTQPLALQGLSSFYEKRDKWEKQTDILIRLLNLFNKSQDAVKCAETIQKIMSLYRKYGTPSQLISGLKYYLPESEIYPLLSTLPPPDPTNPTGTTTFDAQDSIHHGFRILQEIVSLTENLEEDTHKREVEKRRTRLGAAGPEQLKKEVFLELARKSQLPALYDAILGHPQTPDELRSEFDSKQLRYKQKYLSSIPSTKDDLPLKLQVSHELDELVDAIVLLHKPDDLGWRLYLEGLDCEKTSEFPRGDVQQYIQLFPQSSLASLFRGYYIYKNDALPEEDENYAPVDDPLDTVLNSYISLSDTILGNRLIAEIYLDEGDYDNSIKTSRRGLQCLRQLETDTGKTLNKSRNAFQVTLGTALVHFFPPKHHREATRIIDEVLDRSSRNASALMSRAFILQAASEWEAAAKDFDQVSLLLSEETIIGLRAREECAWCRCRSGQFEEGIQDLQHVLGMLDDMDNENLHPDRARCLWRIGKARLESNNSNAEVAFKQFIQALKKDPEFAPAFTSLGIYYLEHASPPDPIRSSKCFQKAFELDAREYVAARRLAEGFANDREWDLVEVVAQRTIDGEGGLNAGLEKSELDVASRYLPTNAWAWKAIGVVKFHYKDYPAAIQAFQVCLRVEPEDHSLWVRLGEAYNKAGRHAAALKALNHALELNSDDWLCSYFIAEVKQCMGLFEDAIQILTGIRHTRPEEAGPLVLLGQSHLYLGLSQVADGFQVRAEESFMAAIIVALDVIKRMAGFRTIAWKIIGDAAYHLSSFSVFTNERCVRTSFRSIHYLPPPDWADKIVKIIPLPAFQDDALLTETMMIAAAIHSYLSQISLSSSSQSFHTTTRYDLGVALQLWTLKASPVTADIAFIKEQVVENIKTALQADSGNDSYWVALGNAYFTIHARAAQHAYIKALEIDSNNAATWVNLGLLYLYHSDVELANEAFDRAQVLDPDNAAAWVGQFLIARANEDTADAILLLEHAVSLTKPVPEADYEFAFRVFDSAKKKTKHGSQVVDTLLPAFFMLNRYCGRRPSDASALHLLSLVCERLEHHSYGEQLVERSIAILESAYEETEDPEVEMRYTIANCTLGRLRLSQGNFVGSAESFESALGLLADKEAETAVLKVQVHLGLGLANFFQGNLEGALGYLEEGLGYAGNDLTLRGQITIVLAQTLWAIGTDELKESAKSRLLECIASDPENLTAINTLAGMGILTTDDNLIDAAFSEILALPIDQKHALDPQRHVDYLLVQHRLAQEDTKQAISLAQRALFREPDKLDQRNKLATLIIQRGQIKDGFALLAGVQATSNMVGDVEAACAALSLQAVALASGADNYGNKNKDSGLNDALSRAQRAIMMRPSDDRGWQTLAYVRARMA